MGVTSEPHNTNFTCSNLVNFFTIKTITIEPGPQEQKNLGAAAIKVKFFLNNTNHISLRWN